MAGKPLQVLIAEDSADDFELVLREIRRGGYDPVHLRVETAEDMTAALRARSWDVVISDWRMPRFDAPRALAIVKEHDSDLPFIIVSGSIDDEIAVQAMRAGAHDFMTKSKLARLLPAIEREMREAALRRERRKMQEQLVMSDRLASMGMLAAGVAHEINNPLAAVIANLDLAAQTIAETAARLGIAEQLREVREELRDARDAAGRIGHIVRDLKIFSRPNTDEARREIVDVQRVMDSTLRMAWNEIRHRARLVKSYGEVPRVEANESRLGQVFLNLVVNAAQAIREGRAQSNEIRIATCTGAQGQAVIEVSDTGPGMPPEILAKIFTPFFTTKPAGLGTGLGLSICQRIVTELGGSIDVESEVGKGATFRVSLPGARAAMAEEPKDAPLSVPTAHRRGTILVVDDEPMIAKAIERMLSAEHDVTILGSAEVALQAITSGARFDVILCDLMMPQMTGMDLHAALARAVPEQADRMVFLTGGAFSSRARAFVEQVPNPCIEKPFDPVRLRALINDRAR